MMRISILLLACSVVATIETPVEGSSVVKHGTADVDGYYNEWNLTSDFYANMYEAGDTSKDLLSKLYLRYDFASDILYALVLTVNSTHDVEKKPDEAWLKFYDISNSPLVDGNSGDDGTAPDFQWVPPGGGGPKQGYEASVAGLRTGAGAAFFPEFDFEAHVNIITDRTSSTGKKNRTGRITVKLPSSPSSAVPEPSTLLVWSLLAIGLLGYRAGGYRRRRS